MSTTWNEIWKNRKVEFDSLDYSNLLKLNGYDGPQSNLTPQNLNLAHKIYAEKMNLKPNQSIFEVGCGAGSFLYNWYNSGHKVGGCDISKNLLECTKKILPRGEWYLASDSEFEKEPKWDHLVSFGVCMYLTPREVLNLIDRMINKANFSVSLFEISDLDKMIDCEKERRRMIPNYEVKYKDLNHFYHSKNDISEHLNKLGLNYTIYDQYIPGYENSKWRFNVTINLV
jgi:cyclopropane fatty-acyl-phospholipid synthase-like methyltransferase